MLQFFTHDYGNTVYINPRHVTSVWGARTNDNWCEVYTTSTYSDQPFWKIRGSADEVGARISNALMMASL